MPPKPKVMDVADDNLVEVIRTQSDQITSLIKQLDEASSRYEKLSLRCDDMADINAKLVAEINDFKVERATLRAPATTTTSPITEPSIDIASVVLSAMNEADLFRQKSTVAVIERIPENVDNAALGNLVEQIADNCGVKDQLKMADIHRHGDKPKVGSAKARIVKVPFTDNAARDAFLRGFRKSLKNVNAAPANLGIRRDLTPSELKVLYERRRETYLLNQKEGLLKYYVFDLQIRKNDNPRPLPNIPK